MSTKKFKFAKMNDSENLRLLESTRCYLRETITKAAVDFMAVNPTVNYFGIRTPWQHKIDLLRLDETQFVEMQTKLIKHYYSCFSCKSVRVKICDQQDIWVDVSQTRNYPNVLRDTYPTTKKFNKITLYEYISIIGHTEAYPKRISIKKDGTDDGLSLFRDKKLMEFVFDDCPIFDKNGKDVSAVEILEVVL
jgi:hypothetical protein